MRKLCEKVGCTSGRGAEGKSRVYSRKGVLAEGGGH